MIWIELLILLACIVVGARIGGIGLGAVSGVGLAIFVFVFRLPPGGPPGVVIGMILAVILMIALAGLTFLVFRPSPDQALKGSIMRSGITAIISIVGLAWLGSSFFEGNRAAIVEGISTLVRLHPWTFAIGLFVLSFLLFSAAAAVSILVPIGIALGLPATQLVVFYPAAAGNFFLPTYGTLLAAVSFDQTGSTRIGGYLLNHRFMRPGMVTMAAAILIAWALSGIVPL